jgi:hypothetical protein
MTPEGKVKERVKALLKKHGAYYHMVVQNGMGSPSLDFVGCHRGLFFAIETKAGRQGMTPRQEATAKEMQDAEGTVFLVNDESGLEDLEEWLLSLNDDWCLQVNI